MSKKSKKKSELTDWNPEKNQFIEESEGYSHEEDPRYKLLDKYAGKAKSHKKDNKEGG